MNSVNWEKKQSTTSGQQRAMGKSGCSGIKEMPVKILVLPFPSWETGR